MLALRPTFSESWYRVANLKVRLRNSAQISRQYYRGERYYVLRDPAGNQFHRLSDASYRFVGLLDGSRTVADAWDQVGGQLDDYAPTQPEVIQILSHLYGANLIDADVTPDATVLLRRHKQQQKRRFQGRLMNVLFPRIPLWDVDRFLKTWMPVARHIFSTLGGLIWLLTIFSALAVILPRWSGPNGLKAAAEHAVDMQHNAVNLIYLYGVFVFTKLIHELGHAFACRRWGGEVHELGIMFLIFIPTPYVDASTAWAFPSKWQRVLVGAAGMIVELFFAALMAFVWVSTSPQSIVNQLAYNAMLIAGVSTLIFNANPLLRYDGYYILSDWLEIPNLRQKSSEYALGLIKRHIFRVKQNDPLPPVDQRLWLLSYAVLSSIYRIFIGVMIVLLVTYQVPVIGVLMAIGGVVTWAVTPLVKLTKYLLIEPELHRKRGRAVAFTLGVAAAVLILVGLIRFPLRFEATGILEAEQHQMVAARSPGFVSRIEAADGQRVRAGQTLMVLRDDELDSRIRQTQAKIESLKMHRRNATVNDPAQRMIDDMQIDTLNINLQADLRRQDELTLRAPMDGRLIAPALKDMAGQYLAEGQVIGQVATLDVLLARATVPQREAMLSAAFEDKAQQIKPDQFDPDTQVRVAGDVTRVHQGLGPPKMLHASQENLPHASLGSAGGEEAVVDPRDPNKLRAAQEQFEIHVRMDNPDGRYLPGQRAYIRFTVENKPLLWQWMRRFLQMVQVRSAASKW